LLHEAGDEFDQRRLAAAARSDHGDEFAVPHLERNILESLDSIVVRGLKGLGYVLDSNDEAGRF